MREKKTKSYFGRVLAFMLSLSMMLCMFHGCGDDTEEQPGDSPGGVSSSDQASSSGDTSSEEGDSESDSGNSGGEDASQTASSTKDSGKTDGGNSKTTSKKTSSGKTTKKSTGTKTTTKKTTTTTKKVTTTKSNTYYAPQVYSNSAPGTLTFASSDGTAVIDYSNTASGYVMVKYSGAYSNIRVQVTGPNGVTSPPYAIFTRNTWEALPLTSGNGSYTIAVYGNNGGTSYFPIVQQAISVSLNYSTVAFIRPNVICNYNSSTSCVQYAAQLTRGCDTDIAKIEAIYKYVVNNFSYDHAKASSVSSSAYIPNLNSIWSSKKGICYDYASTMAAMLRTQGIPTKVVVGHVSGQYHSWISTYVKGSGWIDGIIQFNGNTWKLMDPTFASTGGIGTDWSKKYSYSVKYTY